MELAVAIKLIEDGIDKQLKSQTWADVGAGDGLFTKAIASLLDKTSTVHAFDKNEGALKQIPDEFNHVSVNKFKIDFSKEEISAGPFDGILMANSLHFIKNQSHFLSLLSNHLKPNGRMILVEYDMDKSNPWVPYPISYNAMIKLAKSVGFESVTRLGETPSAYNRANIYSVLIQRA